MTEIHMKGKIAILLRDIFLDNEVLFSYDNSYYTHCYHQTVKEYKSNGSLIRSKTDYYQAIGG